MVTVCFGDPWQNSVLKTSCWLLKFYGRSINLSECRILLSFFVVFKCPFLIHLFQHWEKQQKWCEFERNLVFSKWGSYFGDACCTHVHPLSSSHVLLCGGLSPVHCMPKLQFQGISSWRCVATFCIHCLLQHVLFVDLRNRVHLLSESLLNGFK